MITYASDILSDSEINNFFSIPVDWSLGSSYSELEYVNNNGSTYIATLAHTSTATNEPGVGANSDANWALSDSQIQSVDNLTVAKIKRAVAAAEGAIKNYIQQDIGVSVHTEILPASEYPKPQGLIQYPATDEVYIFNRFASIHQVVLTHTPVHLDSTLTVFQDDSAQGGQATNAFAAESELVIGNDYFLDVEDEVTVGGTQYKLSRTGILYLDGGVADYPRNLKVTYRAGNIEPGKLATLKEITLHTISHVYQMQNGQTIGATVSSGCNPSGSQPLASESLGSYSYSVNTALQSTYGTVAAARLIPDLVLSDLHKFVKYSYIEG